MSNTPKLGIHTYDSLSEALSYIKRTELPAKSHKRSIKNQASWTGADSVEHAMVLSEGWHEGLERISQLSTPILNLISSKIEVPEVYHETTGHSFDVALVLANEPECWVNYESTIQESKGTRIFRIVTNGFLSGGVSQEDYMKRGALVAALVQALELGGYSVELIHSFALGSGISNRDASGECTDLPTEEWNITIKRPDQALDMARLAFVLVHPAMFRRIGFALIDRQPKPEATHSYCGFPQASTLKASADIYIPSYSYNETWNEARVMQYLKDAGILLREQESTS